MVFANKIDKFTDHERNQKSGRGGKPKPDAGPPQDINLENYCELNITKKSH